MAQVKTCFEKSEEEKVSMLSGLACPIFFSISISSNYPTLETSELLVRIFERDIHRFLNLYNKRNCGCILPKTKIL